MSQETKSSSSSNKGPGPKEEWQPYEIGDKTKTGEIISHIYSQNARYIIYTDENGALSFGSYGLPQQLYPAIGEFHRLGSIAKIGVSRKYYSQIKEQVAAALANAFNASEGEDCLSFFTSVESFIQEKKKEIRDVYASEKGFAVYIKNDNNVELWCKNLPDYLKPAVSEFERLRILAQITLPENYHLHVSGQLAWAVTAAFRGGDEYDFKPDFAKVEKFIESRSIAIARFDYLKYSLFSGVLGTIFALCLYVFVLEGDSTVMQLTLGGYSGMVGAMLSILQRSHKMRLDPMALRRNVIMQGITRLLIGILSGTIVIIAAKSELVLGQVVDNNFALMLFAVISGFSERYVPDLMENVSSAKTVPEEKPAEE